MTDDVNIPSILTFRDDTRQRHFFKVEDASDFAKFTEAWSDYVKSSKSKSIPEGYEDDDLSYGSYLSRQDFQEIIPAALKFAKMYVCMSFPRRQV